MPDEPSFFQVDLSVYKTFGFDGGGGYDVFVQAYNVFDRENVGSIEGRAISSSFGQPTGLAGPPRTIELGLRVQY
jgi:outer membrane receptor protein involved in Fe transport